MTDDPIKALEQRVARLKNATDQRVNDREAAKTIFRDIAAYLQELHEKFAPHAKILRNSNWNQESPDRWAIRYQFVYPGGAREFWFHVQSNAIELDNSRYPDGEQETLKNDLKHLIVGLLNAK